MFDDDRAVSELVGFVIVFGIIIGSVGLLFTFGFQSMTDFQEGEQIRNAERAMDTVAENFNDIQRNDGVRFRASEVNLREGSIQTIAEEEGTDLTVDVGRENDPDETIEVELGALQYETGGVTITYDGGGVFRQDDTGEIPVRQPRVTCKNDVAIVSLVIVEGEDDRLFSAENQELSAERSSSTVEYRGDAETVTISVNSEYEDAWETALGEFADGGCEDIDRAIVRTTTIAIDI